MGRKQTDYSNPADILIKMLLTLDILNEIKKEYQGAWRKKWNRWKSKPNNAGFVEIFDELDIACAKLFGFDREMEMTSIQYIAKKGVSFGPMVYAFAISHPLMFDFRSLVSKWLIDYLNCEENQKKALARTYLLELVTSWANRESLSYDTAPTEQELFTAILGFGWFLPKMDTNNEVIYPIKKLYNLLLKSHEVKTSYNIAKLTFPENKSYDHELNTFLKATERLKKPEENSFSLTLFKKLSSLNFKRIFLNAEWETFDLETKKSIIRTQWESLWSTSLDEPYYATFEKHWMNIYGGHNHPYKDAVKPIFLIGLLIGHLITQAYIQLSDGEEGKLWLSSICRLKE